MPKAISTKAKVSASTVASQNSSKSTRRLAKSSSQWVVLAVLVSKAVLDSRARACFMGNLYWYIHPNTIAHADLLRHWWPHPRKTEHNNKTATTRTLQSNYNIHGRGIRTNRWPQSAKVYLDTPGKQSAIDFPCLFWACSSSLFAEYGWVYLNISELKQNLRRCASC